MAGDALDFILIVVLTLPYLAVGFLNYSYLHYGLLAARAEVLSVSEDSSNDCILSGYEGLFFFSSFPRDKCFLQSPFF